jgi:hypothetical protein
MNGVRVGIAAALCGIALATGACSDDDDPAALAGRWEKVGETIIDENVVPAEADGGLESLVIYEDGKLSMDDACSGVMETVDDGDRWRLNLDCGAAKLICDGSVVADVTVRHDYTAENDEVSSEYEPFAEALHVICPDDDVDKVDEYVYVREDDRTSSNAPAATT